MLKINDFTIIYNESNNGSTYWKTNGNWLFILSKMKRITKFAIIIIIITQSIKQLIEYKCYEMLLIYKIQANSNVNEYWDSNIKRECINTKAWNMYKCRMIAITINQIRYELINLKHTRYKFIFKIESYQVLIAMQISNSNCNKNELHIIGLRFNRYTILYICLKI